MYVPLSNMLFKFVCFWALYKLHHTGLNVLQLAIFIQSCFQDLSTWLHLVVVQPFPMHFPASWQSTVGIWHCLPSIFLKMYSKVSSLAWRLRLLCALLGSLLLLCRHFQRGCLVQRLVNVWLSKTALVILSSLVWISYSTLWKICQCSYDSKGKGGRQAGKQEGRREREQKNNSPK